MKTATLGQTGGLSGSIGADLGKQRIKLDGDAIQLALNDPKHPFRVEVRELALKYFPLGKVESPGILNIDRSTPFSPVEFIGQGWSIWRGPALGNGTQGDEEEDRCSLRRVTFDPATITEDNFQIGLQGNESVITGEVNKARLIAKMIQADAKIAQTLFQEEEQKTLRFLHDTFGVTWFEFLGTIFRSPSGYRCALSLYRKGGGSWVYHCRRLGDGRGAYNPALGFAN